MTGVVSAVALLVGLYAFEELLPAFFTPVVAIALLIAPAINWRTWWQLRSKRIKRAALQLDPIASLETATTIALLTAIASTVTALLGLFVVGRVFGWFAKIPSDVFLVILAYPPLVLVVPALLWRATIRRLEEMEGRP